MNQEKQRIAIAEACGWADIKFHNETSPLLSKWNPHYEPGLYGKSPNPNWDGLNPLPDYLNSLDAMHEAVETLRYRDGFEWFDFQKHLLDICGSVMNCIQATAEQRAEALLKTLRLWTEEE